MSETFKNRAVRAVTGLSLVAAMTAAMLSGTPAQASTTCQITDGTASFSGLQPAIDAALAGDTLVVSGSCVGSSFINKPLTLAGQPGAVLKQRSFSGSPTLVIAANPVTVRDLRITVAPSQTGFYPETDAVFNFANLVLSHVVIVGNNSCDCGTNYLVGVKNQGTLSVTDGSVLHWSGKNDDGQYYDIWNGVGATANLVDSTISGGTFGIYNEGGMNVDRSTITGSWGVGNDAGGIWNQDGLRIQDSTIVGNRSINNQGFAIHTEGGFVQVIGSTIARNSDDNNGDGGIQNVGGQVLIGGSILALNGGDCTGPIDSLGYNIIGIASYEGSTCVFRAQPSDQVGTGTQPVNPRLGPLASNGGPTRTTLLKPGSPAIDQIPVGAMTSSGGIALCPASGSTDQRGVARPQGPACDIGAVEIP